MSLKYTIAFVAVAFACCYHVAANSWLERKKTHEVGSVSNDELKVIAQMSDGSEQLETFKREILKPFLKVRVSGTEQNRLVREHIKQKMSQLGWLVDEDAFSSSTPVGEKTFVNVLAVQNPATPRRLTLACHYDSKLMNDAEFIGATDSAAPCAMMIDLAQRLNSSLAQSINRDVTLQLIFFDGEEALVSWTDTDSLYGSRHLADTMENLRVTVDDALSVSQVETIDVMLLLDLIGSSDTKFANWFSSTLPLYKQLQKIENDLCQHGLLDSKKPNHYFTANMYQSMEFYGGIQDDHIPFHKKGVPIVHLISYPFPSVWHKPSDNESALDYATINDIGKILRVFVVEYLGLHF